MQGVYGTLNLICQLLSQKQIAHGQSIYNMK